MARTCRDVSSPVVYRLCVQAGRLDTVVTCFNFHFVVRKEQFLMGVLRFLLRQVFGRMERVSAQILGAFRAQGRAIGGGALRLSDMVMILQSLTALRVLCGGSPSRGSRLSAAGP